MIQCTCIAQAGQGADRNRAQLEAALGAFTTASFAQPAAFRWVTVPPGMGYTAGAPSTSSIVSMAAPTPLEPSRRTELLEAVSRVWMDHTGCSIDEIVAVISDPRD